jgi:hypothetical protein
MSNHVNDMWNAFASVFDYCPITIDGQPGWVYCGLDPVHTPSDAETQMAANLQTCGQNLQKIQGIVHR